MRGPGRPTRRGSVAAPSPTPRSNAASAGSARTRGSLSGCSSLRIGSDERPDAQDLGGDGRGARPLAGARGRGGGGRVDPALGAAAILGLGSDIDTYNAQLMEARADWTLTRSRAWSEEIHGELRLALEALPSDRLIVPDGPHGIVGWLLLPAIEHPPEHRLRLERQLGYTP